MSDIRVDKCFPLPDGLGNKYPWDDMTEVGDSFTAEALYGELFKQSLLAGRRLKRSYTIRRIDKGIYRVWLVEKDLPAMNTSLDWERVFFEGIKACIKCGFTPTKKMIINRRPRLKDVQWDELISMIAREGKIRTETIMGKHAYYRV